MIQNICARLSFVVFLLLPSPTVSARAEVVSFPSGDLTLQGMLYKPEGTGPFPAVVYNHGSAPGMLSGSPSGVLMCSGFWTSIAANRPTRRKLVDVFLSWPSLGYGILLQNEEIERAGTKLRLISQCGGNTFAGLIAKWTKPPMALYPGAQAVTLIFWNVEGIKVLNPLYYAGQSTQRGME